MTSLAQINNAAAPHGLELIKESGYFRWAHNECFPESVYVNAFTHLSYKEWLDELSAAIKFCSNN